MKKELTDKEKNTMRKGLQKFTLPNGQIVVYCLANKESGTGLFSNERLLLLHSGDKSIRYYSKLPEGLPFTSEQQITEGKGKVMVEGVQNFKCYPMKGKTSTMAMEWQDNKNKVSWIYGMGGTKMMNQWIAAVQQMRKGVINQDPVYNKSIKQPSPKKPVQSSPPKQNSQLRPQEQPYQQPPKVQSQMQQQQQPPKQQNKVGEKVEKKPQEKPNNQNQKQQPQNSNQKMQYLQPAAPATGTNPQNPTYNQNQSANSPQYGDVSEEIRALRRNQPNRFNLTNDLSRKNLNDQPNLHDTQPLYQHNSPQDPPYTQHNFQPSDEAHQRNPPPPNTKNNSIDNSNRPAASSRQVDSFEDSRARREESYPYDKRRESQNRKNSSMVPIRQVTSPPNYEDDDYDDQFSDNRGFKRVQSQYPNFTKSKHHQLARSQVTPVGRQRPMIKKNNSHARQISSKKWNQTWCASSDPLQIHEEFIQSCRKITEDIVDQLPILKSDRQYTPVKYQNPFSTYIHDGIIFDMHYFGAEEESSFNDSKLKEKPPLLFDQETYYEAKRQFYNYNFILSATGNKGLIKVPLTCLIEYKGILMFCRASIPDSFDKVFPQQYERQMQQLEACLKMRFIFNSLSLYIHPQGKYFLLWDLDELIPRIPNDIQPPGYFRKQFLLENDLMIDDQRSLTEINAKLTSEKIPQFLGRLETLQCWIINSQDFMQELHKGGLSAIHLPELFARTNFNYLKKIFISEMVIEVFSSILRSQLNYVFNTFPSQQFQDLNPKMVDKIIMDCAHVMVDELFSYSTKSESIWKTIVKQINRKYGLAISKQDVIPGYLLGGIMSRNSIDCFYKTPELNRDARFFVKENTIPRQFFIKFIPKVRRYDLEVVSPLMSRVDDILSTEPAPENFEDLVTSLGLRQNDLPSFCDPVRPQILTYMCNFIALGDHEDYEHIGIYDFLEIEPHTYCSTKICLLAIKWAIKKKNEDLANQIFQLKFEENAFWVGQFNPAISQFYDFFSIYNASTGNFDEAVKLAKSSLVNSIKLMGQNSLPTADKHYQLGNIFFKIGKKQDALKQYLKTKQILEDHSQTTIPEYGVILLKLTLLYLNFGKISQCVGAGLEALKIFDANGGSEQDQIETFEILARAYEITRKNGDMASVGALCSQKFNQTEDPKIFQRMAKIVLLPKLTTLNPGDAKSLVKILSKLEQLDSPVTYSESFSFLHNKSQKMIIMKKIMSYLDNINDFSEQITRKDLFRRHKSLSTSNHSEAGEMLVMLEAIAGMIGYGFLIGSLRQNYYA